MKSRRFLVLFEAEPKIHAPLRDASFFGAHIMHATARVPRAARMPSRAACLDRDFEAGNLAECQSRAALRRPTASADHTRDPEASLLQWPVRVARLFPASSAVTDQCFRSYISAIPFRNGIYLFLLFFSSFWVWNKFCLSRCE